MGIFKGSNATTVEEAAEFVQCQMTERDTRNQALVILFVLVLVVSLRVFNRKRLNMLNGEHVLNISELNNATLIKEVFLAYLSAALLEPVLAIGGVEDFDKAELWLNVFVLCAICLFIWLLTDAFDFTDVMQYYKYHVDFKEEAEKDPKRYSFIKFIGDDSALERQSLVGSLRKDVALWFMFVCIGAACAPDIAISHRDALHAYVIVVLWAIMHHTSRRATAWSAGYFFTFLFPSTALMPLEYCLPLMDVADTVEDLEFLVSYREFVKERTGVELIIES